MGRVIRYEMWEDGSLVALRETDSGERFYQIIHKAENYAF